MENYSKFLCYKLSDVLVRCEFIDKPEKNFRLSEFPAREVGVQAMTVEQEWRPTKLRWPLLVVLFRSYIITSLPGENLTDHQGLSKTVSTSDLIQHHRYLLPEESTSDAKGADRAYKEKSDEDIYSPHDVYAFYYQGADIDSCRTYQDYHCWASIVGPEDAVCRAPYRYLIVVSVSALLMHLSSTEANSFTHILEEKDNSKGWVFVMSHCYRAPMYKGSQGVVSKFSICV